MKTKTNLTGILIASKLLVFLIVLFHSYYSKAAIVVYEILPSQINVGAATPDVFQVVIKATSSMTIFPKKLEVQLAYSMDPTISIVPTGTVGGTDWTSNYGTTNITATTPSSNSIGFTFSNTACSGSCPGSCSGLCPYTLSMTDSIIITYHTLSLCTLATFPVGTPVFNNVSFDYKICSGSCPALPTTVHQSPVQTFPVVYPAISIAVTPNEAYPYVGRENVIRTTDITNGSLFALDSLFLKIVQEPEILHHSTINTKLAFSSLFAHYVEHDTIVSCSGDPDINTYDTAYWKSSYARYHQVNEMCQTTTTNSNFSVTAGSPSMHIIIQNDTVNPDYCHDTIGKLSVKFVNAGVNSYGDSTGYASGLRLYLSFESGDTLWGFTINGVPLPPVITSHRYIDYGSDSVNATIINLDQVTHVIDSTYGLGLYDINHDNRYDDLFKSDTIYVECYYKKRYDLLRDNCNFSSNPNYLVSGTEFHNMCGDGGIQDSVTYRFGEQSYSISSITFGPNDIGNNQTETFEFTHVHYVHDNFGAGCDADSVFIYLTRPPGYMIANYDSATGMDAGSATFEYTNTFGLPDVLTLNAQYSGLDSIWIPVGPVSMFDGRYPSGEIKLQITFQCRDYILHSTVSPIGGADSLGWEMIYKCSSAGCDRRERLGCSSWICFSHPCGLCGGDPSTVTYTDSTKAERLTLGYPLPVGGYYNVSTLENTNHILPNDSIRLDAGLDGDTICVTVSGYVPCGITSSWVQISYYTSNTFGQNVLTPLFQLDSLNSSFSCGHLDSLHQVDSSGIHKFQFYFPITCCGIGNFDTLRAYFVIDHNIPPALTHLIQLRGEFFCIDTMNQELHTCDTYGADFATLHTSRSISGSGYIIPFLCTSTQYLAITSGTAVSGQMNFPYEFRPQIYLQDSFRVVLPPSLHYVLGSSFVTVDTSSGHSLTQPVSDSYLTIIHGGSDTLTWNYDWPVSNTFILDGHVYFRYDIEGSCHDPDSLVRYIYDTAYYVLTPPVEQHLYYGTYNVYKALPIFDLHILSPIQDAVRRQISWNLNISNLDDSSITTPFIWLAWESADTLIRFDSARVGGVTVGTSDYGSPSGTGVIIDVANQILPLTFDNITLYGTSLHCAVAESVEDSARIYGGWHCGGYPVARDSSVCEEFSGWVKMRTKDSKMDWDIVHTSLANFGQQFSDTIIIKSIAEGVMDSIHLWYDPMPGLVLDSAWYTYMGDTVNITGLRTIFNSAGPGILSWNLDSLVLQDTGLIGTATLYRYDTTSHANQIRIVLTFHNDCNFLYGTQPFNYNAWGFGATKCVSQQLLENDTLLVDSIINHSFSISGLSSLCVYDSILLAALDTHSYTDTSYQWYSNGVLMSGETNDSLWVHSTGTYSVLITDLNGCSFTTYHPVLNTPPVPQAGADTTICLGNSVLLGSNSTAGHAYLWLPATGLSSDTISNPVATPSGTTTYILKETINSTGCYQFDTVTVTVNPLPLAIVGANDTICSGDSVSLGTTTISGHSYDWTPGTGLSDSTISNPIAHPTVTRTYTLIETIIATNCSRTDSVRITVNPVPVIIPLADDTICFRDSVIIGNATIAGHTYDWTPGSGLSDSTIANPHASPPVTTTYVLIETITATGCQATDTVTIVVNPLPAVHAGADAMICIGDSTNIGGTTTAGHTYSWSPGTGLSSTTISNPVAHPTATTTYILTETITATGCHNSDTVTVTVNPLPSPHAGSDAIICFGSSDSLGIPPVAGHSYSWTPGAGLNDSTISNPIATPIITTTYIVFETDSVTGCRNSDTVMITVVAYPTPFAGNDTTICPSGEAYLGAYSTAGHTYSWSPGATLNDSTISNPHATPSVTTTYVLTETITGVGCPSMDTVVVSVVDTLPPVILCHNDTIYLDQFGNAAIDTSNILTSVTDNCNVDSVWVLPNTFTVADTGSNPVYIYATDITGNIDSCLAYIILIIPPPPAPALTTNFSTDCIAFQDSSIGEGVSISFPFVLPDSCWHVCENTSVTYQTPLHAGSVYTWSITGMYTSTTLIAANIIAVSWGSVGSGNVEVTETNGSGSVTISHCVRIIEKPIAAPSTLPVIVAGVLNLCLNQVADFYGNYIPPFPSIPIMNFFWDFGDGHFSLLQNPHHSYSSGGSYSVNFTVSNQCGCSNTYKINVYVNDKSGPPINCNTPVCPNSSSIYTTIPDSCHTYNWSVVNGTILSPMPYGPTISVQWNDGSSGPGIVTLVPSACYSCNDSVSIIVPILTATSAVSGPAVVCKDSYETYSVPQVPGTLYHWTLSSPIGTITYGQGTNSIEIHFGTTLSSAVLSVSYENEFLECSGSGLLNIEIRGGFSVSASSDEICAGSDITFDAINPLGIAFNWYFIQDNDTITGLTTTGTGPVVISPWPAWAGSGTFMAIAEDPTGIYCHSTEYALFKVDTGPLAPVVPTGDIFVCDSTPHVYHLPPAGAGYHYVWTVTGGAPATASGNSLNVLWNNSGPFGISVKRVGVVYPYCESTSTTLTVNEKTYVVPTFSFNDSACINTTHTYSIANISSYHYDQVEWSIFPPDAGSVVSGQHHTSVSVQWNNTPMINVHFIIKTTLCGVTHLQNSDSISLVGIQAVAINVSQDTVCENVPVNFSVAGSPPGLYFWNFGDGSFDTSPAPSHAYHIMGTSLTFTASVQIINSTCSFSNSILIQVKPAPIADITYSGNCPNYLLGTGGGGFTYLWQFGGSTIGGNYDTVNVNTPGMYYLTKTNADGCSAIDSFLVSCGGGGGCSPLPSDSIIPLIDSIVVSTCNSVSFYASFGGGGIYDTYKWDFGDGQSETSTTTPVHTYSQPGLYDACFWTYRTNQHGTYCNDTCTIINIPVIADFKTSVHCSVTDYNIGFVDYSTYFLTPISVWNWYNNGVLFSTLQNPIVSSTSIGTGIHNIKLVAHSGTDSCEKTIAFNVPVPPNPGFTISSGPFCEAITIVHFTATDVTPNCSNYFWSFGDASFYSRYYADNLAARVYGANGNYNDTLRITDNFGCTYSHDSTVFVNDNTLAGSIVPEDVYFCPSDSLYFVFNSTGTSSPSSYLWVPNGATVSTNWVTVPGEYNVTVYDNLGCNFTPDAPGYASNYNVPDPVIGGRKRYCVGDSIKLYGYQGTSYTYHWHFLGSDYYTGNLSHVSPSAGHYPISLEITAETDSGSGIFCTQIINDSIFVNNYPATPVIAGPYPHACEGQPDTLRVTNAGSNTVNWSTGACADTIYTYNADIYRATITDPNGCSSHSDFTIHEGPDFGFLISGCFDLCKGSKHNIPGNPYVYYSFWKWNVYRSGSLYFTYGGGGIADNLLIDTLSAGGYAITLDLSTLDGCTATSDYIYLDIYNCNNCDKELKSKTSCRFKDAEGHYYYSFQVTYNTACDTSIYPLLLTTFGTFTDLSFSQPSYPATVITGLFYPADTSADHATIILSTIDSLDSGCRCSDTLKLVCPKYSCNPCDLSGGLKISCKLYDEDGDPYYLFNLVADLKCHSLDPPMVSFTPGLIMDLEDSIIGTTQIAIWGKLIPLLGDTGTFTVNFTDFADSCFCSQTEHIKFPGDDMDPCPTGCSLGLKLRESYCDGYDLYGNDVYGYTFDITISSPDFIFVSSDNVDISGIPGYLDPGSYSFPIYVTRHPGLADADGFCIRVMAWDTVTNVLCIDSICDAPFLTCSHMRMAALNTHSKSKDSKIGMDKDFSQSLELFPNPASNKVSVRYKMSAAAGTLEVMDIHGKLMEKMDLSERARTFELTTSDYSSGLYFVLIRGQDGTQMIKKLAVIR